MASIGVRPSIYDLQNRYDAGDKLPLENLVRAWAGIQALPVGDLNAFFTLGGYHGEPFQYRDQVDALSQTDIYAYWGGWCNHGNVLFPTWHRVYVWRLEQALQSIVPGVMMPFWDETDAYSLSKGIPSVLTDETFVLDGVAIKNPLRSFVLPADLSDNLPGDDKIYVKPAGYETVRYPLSGLVGTPEAAAATAAHNAQYPNPSENTALLNNNIIAWLHGAGPDTEGPTPDNPNPQGNGIYQQFQECLFAPNYTAFSNTTSAAAWNNSNSGTVRPLEAPHNDIHLSVGGFDLPGPNGGESGQVAGANGDMGENNTAGLDPIFFFHHCNVDRMFWLWQKKNGYTDNFEIISGYAGTSSSDAQGPTPGVAPGSSLTMSSPLAPFKKADDSYFTSKDCINIETQLGFTYGPGSLENESKRLMLVNGSQRKLKVSGIDRALFQGSFVIRAYADVKNADGTLKTVYLGHESVLSRRNVVKCANCLTHLEVQAYFSLNALTEQQVAHATFRVEVQHRGRGIPQAQAPNTQSFAALPKKFTFDTAVVD